ncbi:MAG: hypothetical protein ACI8WB_003561 [Phenylobacterium sp.]|jgi:uncharacterized protein (TIGR02444 family)
MTKPLTAKQFWHFSGELYGKPGVKEICLNLQDQFDLNVNLVLLLCWCEQHQRVLSAVQVEALVAGIAQWHQDYTRPMRVLRRRLARDDATDSEAKQAMLDAELALERVEQRLLLAVFNGFEVVVEDSFCLAGYVSDEGVLRGLRAVMWARH